MKILLMDFWNVVNSTGGAEKVLCNMANEFVKRGHEICIVCCDPIDGIPFFYLDNRVKFINLNASGKYCKGSIKLRAEREILRFLGKLDKDKLYVKTRYDNKKVKETLKNIIQEFLPEIIITYDPRSLMCLEYLIKPNVPVIAMLHIPAENLFNISISQTLLESFKNVSCIQVLVKRDLQKVEEFCPRVRTVYIPNVVYTIEKNEFVVKRKLKIVNVGRIDGNVKRQLNLIKAFNKIYKDFPSDWCIEIIGGTKTEIQKDYKKKIIEYIKEHNLEGRVNLLGEIKNVSEKLQEADIFAFPSAFEGMPLALTEAMAAGLPVIGYKSCPSVNELIVDGVNGFLCEDGIDDFAEKLKILMQDAVLRKKMGQNARESMKQFAPEKIWDEWEDLINKVVEESKK